MQRTGKLPAPLLPAALRQVDWFRVVVLGAALAFLLLFLIYPLLSTLVLSLVPRGEAVTFGNLTLANFERFVVSRLFRNALVNTIELCLWTTALATVLGVTYAWFVARVKLPINRVVLVTLGIIPLVTPPFVGSYSWVLLLGRNGSLTQLIEAVTGLTMPSIYGMHGMVLSLTLSNWPYVFLVTYGALSLTDRALEESAEVMGATAVRRLRTLTLPLVTPAILTGAIIVFMDTIGSFGTPAILGGNQYVLPTLIYFQLVGYYNFNTATAIALVSVVICIACLALMRLYLQKRNFTTLTSKVQEAPQSDHPALRWAGIVICLAIVVASLLPYLIVVLGAFSTRWAGTPWPTAWGLDNFQTVFRRDWVPIRNSLMLTCVATVIATLFGALLAQISVRGRFRGRWIIDFAVMLPFILPGIVIGVAILVAFAQPPIVLVGTWTILIVAYVVRRMPYTFRTASASFQQMDTSMEEASATCGAAWTYTTRRVTMPMVAPGIVAGAVFVFITLLAELSATIILYSGRSKTITVSIFEYLISNQPGPAFALGTILLGVVFIALYAINRFLGVKLTQLFRTN